MMTKAMTTMCEPQNRARAGWVWVLMMAGLVIGLLMFGTHTYVTQYYDRALATDTADSVNAKAVMFADADGVVTSISPEAERLTGWTAQELVGNPIETIMDPATQARHREVFEASQMRPGQVRIVTCEVQFPDGVHRITLVLSKHASGSGDEAYTVSIYPADDVKVVGATY